VFAYADDLLIAGKREQFIQQSIGILNQWSMDNDNSTTNKNLPSSAFVLIIDHHN
jgi:hypothetical protein